MADTIRMDSHKLLFHPERVAAWRKGELIYPIEMEVGISGACNHRCIFCAVDYVGYKPNLLTLQMLAPNLRIMGEKGVKSIIFAGEGEPLVNPEAADIINFAKECGIDTAMSTNAALLTEDVAVKEVAYTLGFNDHSYFIRLFKKITGRTPQEYRMMFN